MKLLRKLGATSEIWQIFIADSSSTTGAGLTGLTNATSGLTAYYHRDTDTTATAISLVTMTVGTFTSSGFKEIDSTNMPGWYQLCPPNAALATGAKSCAFHLKGATNMAPLPIEVDLQAQVDVTSWNDTAVASPATAGIPEVNIKNINNVSAASVTTVNANQGTTQPLNFTGTAGSALVKSDMVDVAGAAVSATTAQLGVNVVNWNNTVVATPATAGIPDINVKNMNNVAATSITTINANQGTTQPINFNGTAGSAMVKADVEQINTQTVTAAAGVTFPSSIASPTNITAGTITTVTNLTNAPTSGDFTATMKTSIGTAVAASAVASVTGNVGGNVVGSVGSISGVTFPTNFGSLAITAGGAAKVDGTSSLTESYAAQGAGLTLSQALYGLTQQLGSMSITGTTMTVLKRDNSTTAKTYTLNSATTPTQITEAT